MLAADCAIHMGILNKDTKHYAPGNIITGGLRNNLFTPATGSVRVQIILADNGEVTQLLLLSSKDKK